MKKEVLFTLPAEALHGANKICVLGDFNDWNPSEEFELKIQPDGSASTYVLLDEGKEYKYRFLINGEIWVNDYHAERYERDTKYPIDNCIVSVPTTAGSTAVATGQKKAEKEVSLKSETAIEKVPVKKTKTRRTPAARKKDSKASEKKKVAKPASAKTKSSTSKTRAKKSSTAKSTIKKGENPEA